MPVDISVDGAGGARKNQRCHKKFTVPFFDHSHSIFMFPLPSVARTYVPATFRFSISSSSNDSSISAACSLESREPNTTNAISTKLQITFRA